MDAVKLLPSQLYALSQSKNCEGKEECHWCTAPCGREWEHDDHLPGIGEKRSYLSKRPASHWICRGCMLFRRKKITVTFVEGGFRDGQSPVNHSWFISDKLALGIRGNKPNEAVYKILLKPPTRFLLSLIDNGMVNHLQQAIVNDFPEIIADSKLSYTVNGKPFSYSVYELEHAIRHGKEGADPGVSELIRRFGRIELPNQPAREGPGRPPPPEGWKAVKKVIRK